MAEHGKNEQLDRRSENALWRSDRFIIAFVAAVFGLFAYYMILSFKFNGGPPQLHTLLHYFAPAAVVLAMFFLLCRGRARGVRFWSGAVALSCILPPLMYYAALVVTISIALVGLLFPTGEWTEHCQRNDGVAHCSIFRAYTIDAEVVGVDFWLGSDAPPSADVYLMGSTSKSVFVRFSTDAEYREVSCRPKSGVMSCPLPNAAALIDDAGPQAVWVRFEIAAGKTAERKFGFPNMRKHVKSGRGYLPDLRTR